jgi:hypothetical protein
MKQYCIFNHLYNALRVLLHDSAILLQQADFNDEDETSRLLLRMDEVIGFCENHQVIEDRFIYPLIKNSKSGLPDNEAQNRAVCAKLLQELKELVLKSEAVVPMKEKSTIAEKLILKFTTLVIMNLEFCERKEYALNHVLASRYTNNDLVSVRNTVIDTIPPERRAFFYKWLLRGMKNAEVIYWLQEAKENASEEIFHLLLLTAQQTMPEHQWKKIQDAIVEGEMLA